MNDEMPQLAAQLTELAENSEPGRMLDVERARRVGRTRMRRRRLAGLAGAAAVLVTVGLLGAGFRDRHDGTPVPAVSPTVGPSSLTMNVRFGWVPDWAHSGSGYTVEKGQGKASVQRDGVLVEPALSVWLTELGSEPGAEYELRDAPKVNGRLAYWLDPETITSEPGWRPYHLRWQVPGGRWVQLRTMYLPRTTESEQELLRVAAGVTVESVNVPLPVHFADALGPVRAFDATLIRSNSPGEIRWRMGLGVEVSGQRLSVVATRNTTPQPPPEFRSSNAECRTVGDVDLCVSWDLAMEKEMTPDEWALVRKVLAGVEVVPDFK
ncbi:hypothetical protein [Kitasatospora sp. Root107]|nr:hypothetical protein [Kitasatospora sp. Root107]KQV19747.1 hypothetical protein ASC99_22320 [Kitasatospora sp. Root107]